MSASLVGHRPPSTTALHTSLFLSGQARRRGVGLNCGTDVPESFSSAQSFADGLTAGSIRRGVYLLVQGSGPVGPKGGKN